MRSRSKRRITRLRTIKRRSWEDKMVINKISILPTRMKFKELFLVLCTWCLWIATIAVLATESTARSERLNRLILQHAGLVHVDILPCPGWATKVETLKLDDPGFAEAARRHLEPVLAAGADQIVLGCTHYAFLLPVLKPVVDGRAALVDVADAVALQCLRLAGDKTRRHGRLTLLATAHPERLQSALTAFDLQLLMARLSGPARLSLA